MSMVAPSGIVTFLFTDIEGSTRRWEADADGMRAALAAHDELMRDIVGMHHGYLFKHTGDGICAAFSSPGSAVDVAVAAQRALELPVRMGIATGEAELRSEDYFGAVLNRAARVMAAGHGGQILIDGATAELLSDVDLLDLGQRRLRDIAKLVNLFQVRAADLCTDFPPLRTLEPVPGNLRVPETSFHGREDEIGELQTALKAPRLVTLTGPGGVGKTRLALEIAARAANEFPDGVFVIELASVTDPAAVPDAVATVLGISQQPGMTVADSVAAALQDRLRLLIFDNCEHILDAADDIVEAILASSATVRILATSREGLRIGEELLWPVPSLDQAGSESAAAQLFLERAGDVARGIAPADDIPAVVEICRRLDGIPLAIELAASRLMSMTAVEVRDRLDDRFRLLVGSRRGLERHQTLRATVQWSYDLLDESEKMVLRSCSVFAGGFDLAAACAIAGDDDEFATMDILDALVRKSLLVAARSPSGRTRFAMLETIRQFAEEQLVQAGDAEAARTSHARYFAGREGDVLALWDSPRQRESYEWFDVELPNLRTAFRWARDSGDLDTAVAIAAFAGPIGNWLDRHEATGWAEELIEPARTVDHRRLAELYTTAAQCTMVGRIEEGLRYADAGRSAILSGRYGPVPYGYEAFLGNGYMTAGQFQRAIDCCREMIAKGASDHIYSRAYLAQLLTFVGAWDEARMAAAGLMDETEATDNPLVACYALFVSGWVQYHTDPVAAYDIFRRGYAIAQDSGNRQFEAHFATNLARVAAQYGEARDALDFVSRAIRIPLDSGSVYFLQVPLAYFAALLYRIGRHDSAATILGFAASPLTLAALPEVETAVTHLRVALGDERYEAYAREGKTMSSAAIGTYAFEQIELVRAELVSDEQTQNRPNSV